MSSIRESIEVTSSREYAVLGFVHKKVHKKRSEVIHREAFQSLHPLKKLQITLVSLCWFPPQSPLFLVPACSLVYPFT